MLTGLGGLVTAAVTIPANITGLALIQCRMVAGIAHLRGYDLDDPRVRNAILACMLGEDAVNALVKKRKLPAPPMALATAPVHDPHLDRVLSAEVASELITQVAGKRLAITIGRRVPVVGGVVGMGADGFATWQVGRYAGRELLPAQPPVDLQQPRVPSPLVLRAGARPSRASGTSGAGRTAPAPAGSRRSSARSRASRLAQPGVLQQQRLDRVDARRRRPGARRAGRGRRTRRPAGAPTQVVEVADDVVAPPLDLRRSRRRRPRRPTGARPAAAPAAASRSRRDSVWWASSSRTSGR